MLGEEGLMMARGRDKEYDVILLDVMLADMDGFTIIESLRKEGVETPVLMLSGLSNTEDKLKGLGLGADDYVTKPFERRELIARIKALARRKNVVALSKKIRTGGLSVDFEQRKITVNGSPISLTVKEYSVLELLARNLGTALDKEVLMNHLYNDVAKEKIPGPRILDVFICKLRRKLMPGGEGDNYIHTVWGRGYTIPELPVR
jgi:two-component system cell cycle response regulator CtrA